MGNLPTSDAIGDALADGASLARAWAEDMAGRLSEQEDASIHASADLLDEHQTLLAAAPDLLEACQAILRAFDRPSYEHPEGATRNLAKLMMWRYSMALEAYAKARDVLLAHDLPGPSETDIAHDRASRGREAT